MGYGITIRVSGDHALFTRPEFKVERVSYEVITASAARGIIEAVYWKPAIRWIIDRIHVMRDVKFTSIRRNEVSEKISVTNVRQMMNGKSTEPLCLVTADHRDQRTALVLKDVDYIIEAHFELTDKAGPEDTVEKHYNIALRRLRKGQCFAYPYLGTREFPAQVELIEDGRIPASPLTGVRDLGWMLYDLNYSNPQDIQPRFVRYEMRDGVIDLTKVELHR